MQNIQQKFRTSFKKWTQKDKNQVEQFFLSNAFFSKFYQNKKIQPISRICLYRKLEPNERLLLQKNNRAQAIVLLSGHVIVRKKQKSVKKKPSSIQQEVSQTIIKINRNQPRNKQNQSQNTFLGYLKQFNDTLTLNNQCSVQAPQDIGAEIIFVPCALYNQLQQEIENQRVQKIKRVLQKFFFRLKKKELHELSQSNCLFRQFKMNNYIYRASSKPEQIFILLQGMVKLEKPGFSQQTLKETVLINSGMIFGEKDIKLQERTRNAIACSAHIQVLTIPKNQFLKFSLKAFPDMIFDDKSLSMTKLPKVDQNPKTTRSMNVSPEGRNTKLPSIGKLSRFHANSLHQEIKRSESQERRQYELIRNSHMLVDIKSRGKNTLKLQSFFPKSKQQISMMLKKQKSKLKDLKQSSKFTIDQSLIRT